MNIKITFILLFFLGCIHINAQSFLVSFPNHTDAPTQNPRNLTVCNSSALLQVRLDVANASIAGADVTIQLPVGIEYLAGTLARINGTSGLSISENGGTASAPQFKIGPNTLTAGDYIVFTIDRKAVCSARTTALAGTAFKDIVTGTIPGQLASSGTSSPYEIAYPVLSFTQPATQNNAILGQTYSRNFTITNGGNGCTNEVKFTIDYPSNSLQQKSLTLGGVTITPTTNVGTTSYYTINAANLPGGDFCFGETLTFTETYIINGCTSEATNYNVGWGCGLDSASWCQTVSGSADVTMNTGTANYTQFTVSKVGYVNDCTPFSFKVIYTNGGTGDGIAGGMLNANFKIGRGVATGTALQSMDFKNLNLNTATVNGNTLPHTGGTDSSIYIMDVKDLFTSDPDGAGVGLYDLDGDGFYDDLPAGATATFDIAASMNCSATCTISRSLYYGMCGTISYTSMCSGDVTTSNFIRDSHWGADANTPLDTYFGETLQVADNSNAPSNVDCGIPFRMRFSVNWYAMSPINYNTNQRWTYEITLPAGVSISGTGNPQWNNGKDINSTVFSTPTITQAGNIVTIVSPNSLPGMVYLDLVVDCGTSCNLSLEIPYNFKYINDVTANCNCNSSVFCGTYSIASIICPTPCPAGGARIESSKVERADNSLGWTTSSLTTHQLRSNISAYDLSKALYLDQIDITAKGIQNGIAASNLYLNTTIDKYAGNGNKLTPSSIDVVIKRAGATIASGTSTSFTTTGSTTSGILPLYGVQVIRWNLTSELPAGGLLAGDVYETVAHYTVSTKALPNYDVQTGNKIYFYNLDSSNAEMYCNNRIPEMYLVGTGFDFSPNAQNATNACEIAKSQSTVSRQYAASGNVYKNEIRPGYIMTAYTVDVPTGYTMVGLRNSQYGAGYLTPSSISGNTYHYILPAVTNDLKPSLNFESFYVDMSPTCATASSETYSITGEFQDYYYHYKDLPSPNADTKMQSLSITVPYNTSTKPTVTFTNQTGTIQASKTTESFTVRLANTSGYTSPYTWISIPNVAGVTIAQVVDIATNTALTPIKFSAGAWYKLSPIGLAAGATNDYRIDFNYTTCESTTINVEAGWNCSSFPTDPTDYACNHNTIPLVFIPQNTEVQIFTINQPTTPVTLCTAIPFEYRMSSAGAGNTINNKFVIDLPAGTTYENGSIQAEYPGGSGNWRAVSFTTSGTRTIVDLTTHPNYPADGLPGTLNDGGNSNLRLIGMRFSVNTNCDFVAGSNINIFANANRSCGLPATGNGISSSSLSINAKGVIPSYFIVSTLTPTSGSFNNCTSPVVFNATHTIVSSLPTGSTGSSRIILPPGYGYVSGSYVCNNPDLSSSAPYQCAEFKGVFTNVAGQNYIDLGIPSGMVSGDKINYSFAVEQISHVACSNYRVVLQTIDQIAAVSCSAAPGGLCSNIAIQTGSTSYDYTISNPTLTITNFKGTNNDGSYSGLIAVKNTSTINQTNANPVKIGFYCADALGNSTGSLLGSYTMTGSIAAGATVTENYTFSESSTCGLGKIVAIISTDNNCICETVSKQLDLLPVAVKDSNCYMQGVTSTTIDVLSNDITGDTIIPSTISLVVPSRATGIITDGSGDITSMTISAEGTWTVDINTGAITFVPLTTLVLDPTPVEYNGKDAEGNLSNNALITIKTSIVKVATEATSCLSDGSGYTLTVEVKGKSPFMATGSGAPGNWSGNIWTSNKITSATNYNVTIQDVNACNAVSVLGAAPACCIYEVNPPTFSDVTVSCYAQIPTEATLTEIEFEALGNGDGLIGNSPCGIIVITASNTKDPGCSGKAIRTYNVTEYQDTNNNKVRDIGENTVLNTNAFTQTFIINDTIAPTGTAPENITVQCIGDIPAADINMIIDEADNCNGPVVVTVADKNNGGLGGVNSPYIVTRTYTLTDCSGLKTNLVQTITARDTKAPIPQILADIIIEGCNQTVVAPTAADVCAGTITGTTATIFPITKLGTTVVTWTFDDGNGNIATTTQNVIVKNTIAAPISNGDQAQCMSDTSQKLTASVIAPQGTNVIWYTAATAGEIVKSPTLATVGTVTYYAESVNTTTGCTSSTRTPVTLSLHNCSIGLIKKVAFDDTNNDGYAEAGETIRYSFEITNLGDTPLTNVTVSDIKEGLVLTGNPINLEVGETNSTAFKGIYKISQADINVASITNQATVIGTTPYKTFVTDLSDDSSLLDDKPTVLPIKVCVIEVFNALSLNGDGQNDTFYIRGLECYPENTVEIYNRWGVLVFERDHYNNTDRPFKGISEGRTTIKQSDELPTGTYFYVLKYKDHSGGINKKSGYLYINR